MLGDGSLRFTKKDAQGKPCLNANAFYSMTLKNKECIDYLWNLYTPIRTDTKPNPWPNLSTGKPATQYIFSTRSLPSLSYLHSQWNNWNDGKCKFIKVVPLNIDKSLTSLGLALWIQNDGFKYGKGVGLATESFTDI